MMQQFVTKEMQSGFQQFFLLFRKCSITKKNVVIQMTFRKIHKPSKLFDDIFRIFMKFRKSGCGFEIFLDKLKLFKHIVRILFYFLKHYLGSEIFLG